MRELSLHILDIVQNSITAEAAHIGIALQQQGARLTVTVTDDGKGMDAAQLQRVQDPFFTTRTTRKVGMGISLYRLAAEQTGGTLDIASAPGQGTTVTAVFCTDHLDCAPLGDMAGTLSALLSMNPDVQFDYRHSADAKDFALSTAELAQILDGVPLSEPEVALWLREYLAENLAELQPN